MIVACDVSTTDDDPDPEEDVEEDTDVKTGDEDDGRSVGLVDDCGGGELVLGGGLSKALETKKVEHQPVRGKKETTRMQKND